MVDISTVSHPLPGDVSFNAPNFRIQVEGADVPAGIRRLVERVEFESSDGMADLMRVTFRDPTLIQPKGARTMGPVGGGGGASPLSLRDIKVFQPGNEMSLWAGYGTKLRHIGRVVIRKVRPNFPRNEIPTVEVIGYSKDSVMIDNAPRAKRDPPVNEWAPNTPYTKPKAKGKKRKKAQPKAANGRAFKDTTFADAVRERAREYGFDVSDVDETPDKSAPHTFIQKVGLSDYDFIKGLSNITGYFFWVDADENGTWKLHFKNPATLRRDVLQDKVYTFVYDNKNLGSLMDFEAELALAGAITKLQARVKDPKTGRILEAVFDEENEETPDPLAVVQDDVEFDVEGNVLQGEYKSASTVKLFIGDYSFQISANRRFRTEAELISWAKQWYRRQRENFVLSHGTIIGVEDVMARQIHKLKGLGMGLDGEYFFTNVQHAISNNGGYELTCTMRKVVPELA
jgi:phage protein D